MPCSDNDKTKESFMGEQDLYIIRPSGTGWSVHLGEKTLSVFDERAKAIEAAVVVAVASERHGRVSGVISEEGDNLVPIWEAGWDACSMLS
jgi:hypothetical protein